MAGISETGHLKIVTNFESLITSATAFGTSYNPSTAAIKLLALQTLLTDSKASIEAVNIALTAYSNAVGVREAVFMPFSKLITRVNSSLKASGATVQVIDSAETIVRKLRGKRSGTTLTEEEIKALEAGGNVVNQISVSQLSYDNRLGNFDKFITLLLSVPLYNPNEEDLKIESLKTLYADFNAKNNDVLTAAVQLSNARIARNDVLYKPLTGLVDVAAQAKLYIKSVFGATSPQYKQISKLNFTVRNL